MTAKELINLLERANKVLEKHNKKLKEDLDKNSNFLNKLIEKENCNN